MHRVIAGCNAWAIVFLLAALVLGAMRSPAHVSFGLFAAVFGILAQSLVFALFMGASKLLKEHVTRYALDQRHLRAANAILFPLFRRATIGSLSMFAFTILAGLAASGEVAPAIHVAAGVAATLALAAVLPGEVRGLRAMHVVLHEMERAIPEPAAGVPDQPAAPATPPALPDDAIDLRPRALVYSGTTLLALALGYRYISGWRMAHAVPAAVAIGIACLGAALVLSLRARRVRSGARSA